jgi:hypothetical protein
MAVAVEIPVTPTGVVSKAVLVPLPRLPLLLSPQHLTAPPDKSAQV